MQQDDLIETIANALIAARDGGPKLDADADHGQLRLEDATPIQARVAEKFGPVGGFKVACKPGQPVILAPIYAADIQTSPARLNAGEDVGVELEYGFLVTGDLPAQGAPDYDDRLRAAVSLVPVIEIVRTRLNSAEASDAMKLADNQINGGLVVGPPLADWHRMDLSQADARLNFGDEQILNGPAPVPGGNAYDNLCKFLAHVGNRCGGLQKGQIVITGSLNGLPWVKPGTQVDAEIKGLGEVRLSLN